MSIIVDVDNFVRAESDRMFAALHSRAGGVNRWSHRREPTAIEHQDVIRMNRDTLYSSVIVDLAQPAVLTVPDAGQRYLSVMVIDQDHYVVRVIHEPGEHRLDPGDFRTRYLGLAARILVDPDDPVDLGTVHSLQNALALRAGSAEPFVMPDYDPASFEAMRAAVLELGRANGGGGEGAFGDLGEVDPVRHLIGTALGWGGLPTSEAVYHGAVDLPMTPHRIVVPADVPVDAFWSISVYDAHGFFAPNERNSYSVNSVTAAREPDGSIVVHLGGCDDERPNCIPLPHGWNYVVRLYRPGPQVVDGTWTFPAAERCD